MFHPPVLRFHFWQTIEFNVKVMLFYGTAMQSAFLRGRRIEEVPGFIFRITQMSRVWRRLDGETQIFYRRFVGRGFF